jgi:hypothetical protein
MCAIATYLLRFNEKQFLFNSYELNTLQIFEKNNNEFLLWEIFFLKILK